MRAADAIRVINEAAWRPGMMVNARTYPGYGNLIEVGAGWETYNSSVINDAGEYTEPMTAMPYLPMDVGRIETEDELLYQVLSFVKLVNEHEDREFCRVRRNGEWVAPFHPHNADGNYNWRNRGRQHNQWWAAA